MGRESLLTKESYLELARTAAVQIGSWKALSQKEKIKNGIKKYLLHRPVTEPDPFFWPQGLLALGLLNAWRQTGASFCLQAVQSHLERWINSDTPCRYVDNAILAYALLEMHANQPSARYRAAADQIAEKIAAFPITPDGSFSYRGNYPFYVFADAIGMVSPFLCRYASLTGQEKWRELGLKQISNFFQFAMDAASGLPYHGYDAQSGVKQGVIGWGRAVGWLLVGMTDSLIWLPPGPQRQALQQQLSTLVQAVFEWHRDDGYFCWQLAAREGPVDSSATALIGYAVRTAMECGALAPDKNDALKKIEMALHSSVNHGTVENASAECGGFSLYPQRYGAYPWSLGPALLVLQCSTASDR